MAELKSDTDTLHLVLVKAVRNLSMTSFSPRFQGRKETETFILTFHHLSRISDGYLLRTFQQEEK